MNEPSTNLTSSQKVLETKSVKLHNRVMFDLYSLYIIIKKTITFDLYSRLKLSLTLIFMVLGSTLFIIFIEPSYFLEDTSLNVLIGLFQVFISYCIIFAIVLTASSASLISEEIKTKTMVLLVSKPITRNSIVFGKYLAILIYGLGIIIMDLGLVCLITFLKHPFYDLIPFFYLHFIYSWIVIFFFSTISIGFSLLSNNPKVSTLIPIILIFITFLGFFAFKPALLYATTPEGVSYYEAFQVYHYDLGYHFINVYDWMYSNLVSPIPLELIYWLSGWGIYKVIFDDILSEPVVTRTNYYAPQFSLLYLIVIALVILILGYIIFKRKDIK